MEFNFSVEEKEGVKVINLDGNLSIMNAESLEKLVDQHTQKSSVILNMSEVELVTSSGFNSLVNVCVDARTRNNRVLLMRAGDQFKKMVDILKSYEYFIMVDTVEEGQRKVKYYT